ncbi:unnamed protein product [Lactuca saligna]|uniref:Kinetochore protein Nuf2 N-terminal domain-containing protein n=1 Tax=Lactuca saligna TaxID=75948 RepID=A0AA35VAX5_LACSI|nr:unnamed protein product [Lactuca saligna]
MSKYDYPTLPQKEIIGVLAESEVATVSEAELINPRPDFINNLYTQILVCISRLQEDQGLVEFADLEQRENPDLHVDSRLMDELNPVLEDLTNLGEQQQEVEGRVLMLSTVISEINESKEREMPFIQEVEIKIKELRQTISALKNHQMSLKATFRKKKDVEKEMDEKVSSAEFALVQSAQENASLRSKIVQSPAKLQKALEEKKAVQIEAKNAEREAMQSFLEQTATLEVYAKASKKMTKHLKQMQT